MSGTETFIPGDRGYLMSHEWAQDGGGGLVTIGITDYAQQQLGDIVFVELPELGQQIDAGEQVAVIESVKAASDIYAPVSGEVVEVNDALTDAPEHINTEPYGNGWLYRVRVPHASELDQLMDAETYQAGVERGGPKNLNNAISGFPA